MVSPEDASGSRLRSVPDSTTEFDRTPPQDIAAEQSVLGGMMLSKDAIADVVEVLRPGDFYRPAHQIIYDASSISTGGASPPTRSPSPPSSPAPASWPGSAVARRTCTR